MTDAKRMLLVSEDFVKMVNKYGEKPKELDQDESGSSHTDELILSTLPKTYKAKGGALISFLKSHDITYDDKHRIAIKGKAIQGSNFTDSIHDLIRYRDVPPPQGFETLAKVLKRINVSRELITNLERYKYISDSDGETKSVQDIKLTYEMATPTTLRRITKRPRLVIPKRKWVSW